MGIDNATNRSNIQDTFATFANSFNKKSGLSQLGRGAVEGADRAWAFVSDKLSSAVDTLASLPKMFVSEHRARAATDSRKNTESEARQSLLSRVGGSLRSTAEKLFRSSTSSSESSGPGNASAILIDHEALAAKPTTRQTREEIVEFVHSEHKRLAETSFKENASPSAFMRGLEAKPVSAAMERSVKESFSAQTEAAVQICRDGELVEGVKNGLAIKRASPETIEKAAAELFGPTPEAAADKATDDFCRFVASGIRGVEEGATACDAKPENKTALVDNAVVNVIVLRSINPLVFNLMAASPREQRPNITELSRLVQFAANGAAPSTKNSADEIYDAVTAKIGGDIKSFCTAILERGNQLLAADTTAPSPVF